MKQNNDHTRMISKIRFLNTTLFPLKNKALNLKLLWDPGFISAEFWYLKFDAHGCLKLGRIRRSKWTYLRSAPGSSRFGLKIDVHKKLNLDVPWTFPGRSDFLRNKRTYIRRPRVVQRTSHISWVSIYLLSWSF